MNIICGRCGEFLDLSRLGKQRYCKKCHAEHMRATRPKHSELNPIQKKKSIARSYARVYQLKGGLIPQPCEKCGSEKVEKHHEDYDKPLEVIWLCRPCHLDLHQKNKVEDLEMEAQNTESKFSGQA